MQAQQKRQGMQCLPGTPGFPRTVKKSEPVAKNGEGAQQHTLDRTIGRYFRACSKSTADFRVSISTFYFSEVQETSQLFNAQPVKIQESSASANYDPCALRHFGIQCLADTTGFSVTVQLSKPVSKNGEGAPQHSLDRTRSTREQSAFQS